jgi:hypothetical protein
LTYSPCLPQTPLMGKGSGWNTLGRRAEPLALEPPAPLPPPASIPAPVVTAPRLATVPILPPLSPYATARDLRAALGGVDGLIDAYVQGTLPAHAVATLESNYPQLQCWLLARLIRLTLQPEVLP